MPASGWIFVVCLRGELLFENVFVRYVANSMWCVCFLKQMAMLQCTYFDEAMYKNGDLS